MKPVIIIGGTVNNVLKKWLTHLGIKDINHIEYIVNDISIERIGEEAKHLREILPTDAVIITIGSLADRLLNLSFVVHGALPATSTKDKKKIEAAIGRCRDYLTMRSYYGTQSTGSRIS